MNQLPKFSNLIELLSYFSDEKTCIDNLEQQLWNGKPVCPHCGSDIVYRLSNYKQFKCGNKKTCDKKFTVTTGTIYENTKIHLQKWFATVYLVTCHKKGISSLQLHRDLGITQKTAWFMLHRIRESFKEAGIVLNDTVQIDETYVRGKAKNRTKKQRYLIATGQKEEQETVVLGMVQNGNNAVLKVVDNAETNTLRPVIEETVKDKETVIVTDAHTSYPAIGLEYRGHIIINHSNGEYVNAGYTTNSIESAFAWFKRCVYGTFHWVSKKHAQRYCSMFSYRYCTRKMKEDARFINALQQSKGRLKYADLIKK